MPSVTEQLKLITIEQTMKPIPNFPNYFASPNGDIIFKKILKTPWVRKILKTNFYYRKLKQCSGSQGKYMQVTLSKDGIHYQRTIHSLVLLAFRSKPGRGETCCHGINGRFNNSINNLAYGNTTKNYLDDKYRDGTAKTNSKIIKVIRHLKGKMLNKELAKIFGVSPSFISMVQNGKRCNA